MQIRWPFSRKKSKEWVGVQLSVQRPAAVICSPDGIMKSFSVVPAGDSDEDRKQTEKALYLWLKKHTQQGMPAVIVLDDADYELHLVESPDVPEEELSSAIAFRVQDLVSYPAEETSVQAFALPSDAYRGRMRMAYAVAAHDERIRKLTRTIDRLKLTLDTITIPELSTLNLIAAHDIEQSIAVLNLEEESGMIRLYSNGALYLTRQMDFGWKQLGLNSTSESETEETELALVEEDDVASSGLETENLILEIQRSLDYYESQLGMGQITQLWMMAGDLDLSELVENIQQSLTARVEQPDLNSSLQIEAGMPVSDDCDNINCAALAVGGALSYVPG